MIYIVMFIIGCLLIKISKLNKSLAVYKNNYYTAIKILGEYDPNLKNFLEAKLKEVE